MDKLEAKRCLPCEGGTKPLDSTQIKLLLGQLSGWEFDSEKQQLKKLYLFKNFYLTMAFVNAIAWIAHQEKHHPDIEAGYDYCLVKYSTHAIGGLFENDFICAAKVDLLLKA